MTMTYQQLLEAIDATSHSERNPREIKDPATGEVVGYAPDLGKEAVDQAVEKAWAAQRSWAAKSQADRDAVLQQIADVFDANSEALAELLSREQGKPLNGPNARFEVGGCSAWTRATASFELQDEVVVDDGETKAIQTWDPVGIVGAIGPWNWPMMISIWQIIPSVKMGNAVIVKPSEHTPLSVLALVHLINTVLPEGVVQVVAGGREVGTAITAHPGINKIMFTGSTPTGRKIAEASAPTLKRLTMELGGNDAGIVLEDADVKALAEGIFWGAFLNTGQTCAALKRLYVPESRYDELCAALTAVAEKMPMGVGVKEENVLGPLQNKQQFDIVDGLVKAAVDSGARVLIGANPDYDQPGFFYPTTLIADIDNDNPLVAEEQFGPALPIIRYTTLEQAIEWANGLDVGLGASVWGSDLEEARKVARRLQAGSVWINAHGAIDPRIPFGGVKQSGYGVEFGVEGLKGVVTPKIING